MWATWQAAQLLPAQPGSGSGGARSAAAAAAAGCPTHPAPLAPWSPPSPACRARSDTGGMAGVVGRGCRRGPRRQGCGQAPSRTLERLTAPAITLRGGGGRSRPPARSGASGRAARAGLPGLIRRPCMLVAIVQVQGAGQGPVWGHGVCAHWRHLTRRPSPPPRCTSVSAPTPCTPKQQQALPPHYAAQLATDSPAVWQRSPRRQRPRPWRMRSWWPTARAWSWALCPS